MEKLYSCIHKTSDKYISPVIYISLRSKSALYIVTRSLKSLSLSEYKLCILEEDSKNIVTHDILKIYSLVVLIKIRSRELLISVNV